MSQFTEEKIMRSIAVITLLLIAVITLFALLGGCAAMTRDIERGDRALINLVDQHPDTLGLGPGYYVYPAFHPCCYRGRGR